MKKQLLTLTLIVLLATISLALNIELKVTPTKPEFYDNESVLLNINVTNYELSLAASNAKVIVKVNEENKTISIGTLQPDEKVTKTLDLDKFDAGTYRLETYVEYDFLGIRDKTQTQYQNIQVLPSVPIRMKTYSVFITDIKIPEDLTINKRFTIKFDVNSSTDLGYVEYGLAGEKSKTKRLKEGMQTFTGKYEIETAGSYVFEVKAYTEQDRVVSLKDYRTRNFIVIDPSRYEQIEYKPIEKKEGNVTIEVGKEPERNLIEEVGCFIIGGCKGDLTGPEIKDIEMLEQDGKTIFTITADDSNTGNSKITGCSISIGDGEWQIMATTDGSYDNVIERASFTTSILHEQEQIRFQCVDELRNIAISTLVVEAKQKGQIRIKVIDPLLSKPISRSKIYINDVLKGMANDNGIFEAELYSGRYSMLVTAKGYANKTQYIAVEENKRLDVEVLLSQTLEMRFEIPEGYEKFVYASKAAKTDIHPHEKRLRSYSFPLYSTNKEDVAKDLIHVVDNFLVYTKAPEVCWTNYYDGCVSWHRSDYKVIETGKGVCYDWATLGTSFTDSYGIPARYVHGCWKSISLTGEKKGSCHAWQEVYLPELGGWKHLDTLWNEFDNPCVYASGMSVKCVSGFGAYNPDTGKYDDLGTYLCGKECDKDYVKNKNHLETFEEEGSGYHYRYNVNLNQKTADVRFTAELDQLESKQIREAYEKGTFNEETVEQALLDMISPQFEDLGEIDDVKLSIENREDDSLLIIVSIDFNLAFSDDELSQFRHEFTITQYSDVNYTLKTPLKVISISPAPNTKRDKQFNWFFDSSGTHIIDAQFMPEKIGFIVYNDPILKSAVEATAKKLNAKVYSKEDIEVITSEAVSKIHVLGGYTDISSDIEEKLKNEGIQPQRFIGDEIDSSVELALMFWSETDVVIADVYDYDSVKSAEEYAIQEEMPLLLIKNDAVPKNVENAIKQLKVEVIHLSDPNDRFTEDVKNDLNNIGKTKHLGIPREVNKILKEVNSESISYKDQTPMIFGVITIIILLVIIMAAFLILKKRG